jgi:hypothetical protein
MRIRLDRPLLALLTASALVVPALAACSADDSDVLWSQRASEEKVTDVVDGIGDDEALALARVAGAPSNIARTPGGATMLAWSVAGMEGERSASAWMSFSPTGQLTASRSTGVLLREGPLAYDGGFLLAGPGDDDPGTPMLVSEAGAVSSSPRVADAPRSARAGDLLLGAYGWPAFRPSDGTFAPLPRDGADHDDGVPPTVLSPAGALTSLGGTVRKLVLSFSADGGRTWDRDTVVLPRSLLIDQAEFYANSERVILLVMDRKYRLAGWLSRATHATGWSLITMPEPTEELATGLVGDRLLITTRTAEDSDEHGGLLVSLADPADVLTVDRHALRASGGRLYSLSPTVTESVDGRTWTDVPLDFSPR